MGRFVRQCHLSVGSACRLLPVPLAVAAAAQACRLLLVPLAVAAASHLRVGSRCAVRCIAPRRAATQIVVAVGYDRVQLQWPDDEAVRKWAAAWAASGAAGGARCPAAAHLPTPLSEAPSAGGEYLRLAGRLIALARRCMAFEAGERPSAAEVSAELGGMLQLQAPSGGFVEG
jgi:hypothetical protein